MSFSKAAFYLVAGALLVPCVGTVSELRLNAWAQPAAPEAQVKAAWEKVLADFVELEATDPQGAITRYQQFFEETGYRSPAVGVQISLRIARIYQFEFRNYDKAIEIYDWALSLYKDQPTAIALQRGRLTAIEAQNKVENVRGNQASEGATGAAPLAVPIPKPAGGASLGVNIGTPNKTGGLGIGVTPPINSGVGVKSNPFSPSKSDKSQLGINLPSTVGTTQPVSISAPAPLGTALGWNPGQQRCVTALAQQPNGMLWVATEDSGVWRYDPAVAQSKGRWTQFTAKDGLADESAYALAVDGKGRVWAGTLNHGVSVWSGKEWKNYGVLDGPLGERVFDIAVCPTDGDVWIATNAGLTRYSQQKDSWSYVTRADGLPSDQVQAIAFDKSGNIILGTQCHGVALSQAADDYKKWRVVQGPEKMPLTATGKGLPSNLINDVLVARDGVIYAATTTGLAWSSDKGKEWFYVRGQNYAEKVRGLYDGAPVGWKEGLGAILAEDYVSCLAENQEGDLWIGHWEAGNEMVQMQKTPVGLSIKEVSYRKQSGFVKAMLQRNNGALLLAIYNEGLGYGSTTTEKNDELPKGFVEPKIGFGNMAIEFPSEAKTEAIIIPKIGVANMTVKFPSTSRAKVVVEPKIGVADMTIKFPLEIKDPIEPKTTVTNTIASLPRTDETESSIEPKATVAIVSPPRIAKVKRTIEPKTVVESTIAPFPSAVKAPTLVELNAIVALLNEVEPLNSKTPVTVALPDDWRTQGDWLGRYGRYYARLHAIISPSDYVWGAGTEIVPYVARIGKNAAPGDSVRYWVQWLYTDNPSSLEMPPIYYDSRLKKGLAPLPGEASSPIKNRRQAELDDHGEVYSKTLDGPDIFVTLQVPDGDFTLSFYDFNKDGDGADPNNRMRDYRLSLRSHPLNLALDNIDEFETWPELAKGRIRDFRGGVYKRFLVRGPQAITIRVNRNYSFNTILSGVFLDKLTEEPEPYFPASTQHNSSQKRLAPTQTVALKDEEGVDFQTEARVVDDIWRQLERIHQENPVWLAAEGRKIYARLLLLLEQDRFRQTNNVDSEAVTRKATCYYQLGLFPQWEALQQQRGLIPARATEKSLSWKGEKTTSGQGRAAILQATKDIPRSFDSK